MKTYIYVLIMIFSAITITACATNSRAPSATTANTQSCAGDLKADADKGWNKANLTYYTSYPEKGSKECHKYNGCKWAGRFSAISGKRSKEWVQSHNIIAVHSKDYKELRLKKILLRKGKKRIVATVYDQCSDLDCKGCCTKNLRYNHLIDIEKNTMERFGPHSGIVEWKVCE